MQFTRRSAPSTTFFFSWHVCQVGSHFRARRGFARVSFVMACPPFCACFMCDLAMGFVLCCVVMCPLFIICMLSFASVLGRSQCGHVPEGHAESMCVPWFCCVGRFVHVCGRCCVRASCMSFIARLSFVRCRVVRLSFVCGCQCALVRCVVSVRLSSCSISCVMCAIVICAGMSLCDYHLCDWVFSI